MSLSVPFYLCLYLSLSISVSVSPPPPLVLSLSPLFSLHQRHSTTVITASTHHNTCSVPNKRISVRRLCKVPCNIKRSVQQCPGAKKKLLCNYVAKLTNDWSWYCKRLDGKFTRKLRVVSRLNYRSLQLWLPEMHQRWRVENQFISNSAVDAFSGHYITAIAIVTLSPEKESKKILSQTVKQHRKAIRNVGPTWMLLLFVSTM